MDLLCLLVERFVTCNRGIPHFYEKLRTSYNHPSRWQASARNAGGFLSFLPCDLPDYRIPRSSGRGWHILYPLAVADAAGVVQPNTQVLG